MAIKTHKVTLSLDNPRVIQSGINVQSFDKQSIQISIELTKNDEVFQVPSDATIRVSLLKLARQEQKIIVDVPNTNRDSIDWIVPDYLDGYQGTVRVGVYLVSGAENVDLGYFTILSNVSDIDKMADEFVDNVFQGWEQIEADLNELNLTIAQAESDLNDILTTADSAIANINAKNTQVNTLHSDFTTDVATKQSDVTSKYNAFDTDITEANQTIDDILALQPQFQSVLDETTGKDVISAPEIILARNGEVDLKTRLDKEKQEVSAQLAQKATEIAVLQGILKDGNLNPYYVENMASFNYHTLGTPAGLNNYPGGNYFLGISGNEGDSFVTVKTGNIDHAGTSYWGAVIKDDEGNWIPYSVTGVNGSDKLNISPPLKKTILSGEIANIHDAVAGQHYTERGYFALAQHIYKSLPKYAERNKYFAKFRSEDTASNSPWTIIGNPFVSYNLGYAPFQNGYHKAYTPKNLQFYCGANGSTQGAQWTQNIASKKGFLETFIGSKQNNNNIIVEFHLDGVLKERITGLGTLIERIVFPFSNATTATVKVFIENVSVITDILISDTTWWSNERDSNPAKFFHPHSKVVFLGDSWGTYHDKALTRELGNLISKDTGTTVEIVNPSVPGMTSAWGKAWFNEYVLKEKPSHVIIEFFVNDYNSSSPTATHTYLAPDGQSYSAIVTKAQWRNNIREMCNLALLNGIQPIVVCPCATASGGQTQFLSEYNVYLVDGETV